MASRRRRRGGFSVTGFVIIIALLYFTGAGSWLWERVKTLDESCYDLMVQANLSAGGKVCEVLGRGIEVADNLFSGMRDQVASSGAGEAALANIEQSSRALFARMSESSLPLAGLTSSGDRLRELVRRGPELLGSNSNPSERLRTALDQFVIGQYYMQEASASQAMPWFQQSAQQPGGYGVLSQLKLGDMYRSGSGGIPANNSASIHYYEQAQASIATLQQSPAPQAQQLLRGLPASPDTLLQQITMTIRQLKRQ